MKDQSLRVLIVEDSEDDALLIIRELKKGGYNPVYKRVETAAAIEEIEKNKGILYDNTVADTCLKLFREKNYQIR